MKLQKFQIFEKSDSGSNVDSLDFSKLSDDAIKFVTAPPKGVSSGVRYVLFDGVSKAYEQRYNNYLSGVNFHQEPLNYTADLPAPIGPITAHDYAFAKFKTSYGRVYQDGTVFCPSHVHDKSFAKHVSDVILRMVDNAVWDEMVMYRFISFNEFLEFGGNLTFGAFVEQERLVLDEKFMHFSSEDYSHTQQLTSAYSDSYLLYYREKGISKAAPIINSLTVEEVLKLIRSRRESVTQSSYVRTLEDRVAEIRAEDFLPTFSEVEDSLLRSFLRSIDKYSVGRLGMSRVTFAFLAEVENLTNNNAQLMKKWVVAQKIDELAETLTPVEILTVLFVLNNPRVAFRSCNHDEALFLVSSAFERLSSPETFILFLSQLVFDYDGPVASYGEWTKSINGGLDDYTLGPLMSLSFLVSPKASTLPRTISPTLDRFRKTYSNWAN